MTLTGFGSTRVPYDIEVEVSIVVPTLDITSEHVRRCLHNVKATMRIPHELIVIDNGAPPQGFTAPVNAGLRAARGRYLVVLNDDVEVLDGWWEPLARALDLGNAIVFPRTIDAQPRRFPAWCFAMRRDTLETLSVAPGECLDPAMRIWYSDTDLLVRLSAMGTPPICVPESQIRHSGSHTINFQHRDAGFRRWLHAQIASDRAAFQVKHPNFPKGPHPRMSPEHRPISIATELAIHTTGPGWHGQSLRWPAGAGHFFLAGELTLDTSPEQVSVQLVFTDEQDNELFYFNLAPGSVRTSFGYFCLPRERARAIGDPAEEQIETIWSTTRNLLVRGASDCEASVFLTNLRAFAQPSR